MPRLGRKTVTSASTSTQHTLAKRLPSQQASETSSVDYSILKRVQLQQQCKKLGLRATGKNAELVERLKTYHEKPQQKKAGGSGAKEDVNRNEECQRNPTAPPTVSDQGVTKDIKTEPSEEKTDLVQGWCVVHGMVLYRPRSSWASLQLRGGLVCVQDGKDVVPFHLPPLNLSVPKGFADNYVCLDCVLRTTEIRKLYQPQEDQAYAQRVDGILSQMARGELGMDRALCPLQPLVFHSPAPFDRCGM